MALTTEAPEALNAEEFDQVISDLIESGERHVDDKIRPQREDVWRRYYGHVDHPPSSGGSDLVVTAIQDSVLTILPDLLALFMGTDKIVEFLPGYTTPEEAAVAHSASCAATSLFWQNNGFKATHDALHEGVTTGFGFFKVYQKESIKTKSNVQKMDEATAQALSQKAQIETTGQPNEYRITQYDIESKIWVDSVAASNIIWTYSPEFKEAALLGEVVEVTLGDLRKLGFSVEELADLDNKDANSSKVRNPASWALRKVAYYEVYAWVDADGDGLPEYYKIIAVGSGKKVLRRSRVDDHPYVLVPAYRIPNSSYSQGVGQRLKGLQEAESFAGRALVDDTDMAASPVIKNARAARVDPEQLAVWKKHKIIDCEMTEGVEFWGQPSHQNEIMGVIEYLKKMREDRVGISQIAAGLDINSLSEITATLARGVLSAAQRKIDYLARVIAEYAFVEVFRKILALMIKNSQITVNMNGQMVQINTQNYNPEWQLRPKVGLGISSKAEKQAFLQLVYQTLADICTKLGNDNAITDLTKIRQIIVDYGETSQGTDANRYVKTMEESMAKMQEEAQAEPPPDPKMEQVKAQAEARQQEMQLKAQQAQQQVALDARQAEQDAALKAQEAQQKVMIAAQTAQQKAAMDLDNKRAELALEYEDMQRKFELKQQELMLEHSLKLRELRAEAVLKGVELQLNAAVEREKVNVNTNLRQVA
jgi:hypothetical protein